MEQQFQIGPNGASRSSGTTAIDRGAELLVRVLESEQPVALAEHATASGIPKSTASRLLSALERQGLVQQDGARGRLRPGPAILRVAERSMVERSILELARPSLDTLGALTGETINLAVPGPQGVEHIAQVESRHFLGAGQWLGRSAAYHCTANGKVFMASGRAPADPGAPPGSLTAADDHRPRSPQDRAQPRSPRCLRRGDRGAGDRSGRHRRSGARGGRAGGRGAERHRPDGPDDNNT